MSAEKEIAQGKRIAESIPDSVEHIVYSTLPDTRKALGEAGVKPIEGDYTVPHFDAKASIEAFMPADKTTMLETAFYYQNLDMYYMCMQGVLTLPVKKYVVAIDYTDIGKSAYNIFKDPSLKGKHVQIAGDKLTGEEFCQIMSEVTGKEFKFNFVATLLTTRRTKGLDIQELKNWATCTGLMMSRSIMGILY
jgi:hypothetical protein